MVDTELFDWVLAVKMLVMWDKGYICTCAYVSQVLTPGLIA